MFLKSTEAKTWHPDLLKAYLPKVSGVQSQQAALDFISRLTPEFPALVPGALNQLNAFVSKTSPLAFTHMDRNLIAVQLFARLTDPLLIAQDDTCMCGPLTLVQNCAKADQKAYVDYVTGLADDRKGELSVKAGSGVKVKVKKGSALLQKSITSASMASGSIAPADYIALASLRESGGWFPYEAWWTSECLQGWTFPSKMKEWMKKAGYSSVRDHSRYHTTSALPAVDLVRKDFERHLQGAQSELSKQRVVMLYTAAKLTQFALSGPTGVEKGFGPSVGGTWIGGHWMFCKGITTTPTGAKFALYSWGKESDLLTTTELPWSKVVSWYRGYVSGQP